EEKRCPRLLAQRNAVLRGGEVETAGAQRDDDQSRGAHCIFGDENGTGWPIEEHEVESAGSFQRLDGIAGAVDAAQERRIVRRSAAAIPVGKRTLRIKIDGGKPRVEGSPDGQTRCQRRL